MKQNIRQGDLLFVPRSEGDGPIKTERLKRIEDGILARGEATGHKHQLEVLEAAEIFEGYEGMLVLVGPEGVRIMHEEHGSVALEPNTDYIVHRAREFDYLENIARIVAD